VIVDSSALIAVVRTEPQLSICLQALYASPVNRMSAANLLESAIVVDRLHDPETTAAFDLLIPRLAFVIEPVTAAQVAIARDA
jgi:ribonuclease VapC